MDLGADDRENGVDLAEIDNMLSVLPSEGEYKIVKRTKYGVYVRIDSCNVFLPNEVLTFEDDDREPGDGLADGL